MNLSWLVGDNVTCMSACPAITNMYNPHESLHFNQIGSWCRKGTHFLHHLTYCSSCCFILSSHVRFIYFSGFATVQSKLPHWFRRTNVGPAPIKNIDLCHWFFCHHYWGLKWVWRNCVTPITPLECYSPFSKHHNSWNSYVAIAVPSCLNILAFKVKDKVMMVTIDTKWQFVH